MRTGSRLRILLLQVFLAASLAFLFVPLSADSPANLVADPSFETPKARDQFGNVFAKWGGWTFEGDCRAEVGEVPHSGKTSALLVCNAPGKIRINQPQDLPAGRYLITAYIRGLNIGVGDYDQTTEFMFNEKYMPLKKNGTFGWTRMTYVADLKQPTKTGPSFGLWGAGFLWIDDVSMVAVSKDTKLTETPVFAKEESPIAPPSALGPGAVHCPRCGYRNMPEWHRCYACGEELAEVKSGTGPPSREITSFEQGNPFGAGSVVASHATDGAHSLQVSNQTLAMVTPQDWNGFDYLKFDSYTDAKDPVPLTIEIQDTGTTDYWTRVNYNAIIPPGQSTLLLPLKQLYVGEKGRPGRGLLLGGITRLVLAPHPAPGSASPLYLDHFRLERDLTGPKAVFEGLSAFDFGTGDSPVLDGFTAVTAATTYNSGRGYGLKDAKVWRAFNVFEPDPLYQDYICIESGGFAVDIPNGTYRVVVNVDAAAGFWGENQIYRERSILAQGKTVISEKQNFQIFQKKYFHFWDQDDLPGDNTFDKYDRVHFAEKTFDARVTNGQLYIEFHGENWANSVSSLIAFPVEKAAEGKRFLDYVRERRRFYFDNNFKRVLHRPTGDPLQPTAEETRHGFVLFQRDLMKDVFYNDTPFRSETGKPLTGDAFPGQTVPLIADVVPLRDLGHVEAVSSDLTGAGGVIPASAVEIGYGSYRLSRVSADGAVYTINPRLIVPKPGVDMPQGVTRAFWFTVHTPPAIAPGEYTGKITLNISGSAASLPVRFRVRKGSLDPVTIPIGPFGGAIGTPWYAEDPAAATFTADMTAKSLRLLRARGFTMFSGIPTVGYEGFQNGLPALDFTKADRQMQEAKNLGFIAVDSYGAGLTGLNGYFQDTDKMKEAGFTDYSQFVRAIYTGIQQHAREKGWIGVYWNLGDEPNGDDVKKSETNAAAYHAAFPKGPPYFTIATSLEPGRGPADPHFDLAKNLSVPALNTYDEAGVKALRQQGGDWAFYNEGSRWTYGAYLYKAVTQFTLRFRIAWHWNVVAGDPYYALDSREDDYAWANASPAGQLVPSIEFERIAAGLDDYRELVTLARLSRSKPGTPAAQTAASLISTRMAAFHLNDKNHDALFGVEDWARFRTQVSDAIESLQ